ncbi:MAG: hypothetical protein V1685_07435 [Parcubacteria group bacterium]
MRLAREFHVYHFIEIHIIPSGAVVALRHFCGNHRRTERGAGFQDGSLGRVDDAIVVHHFQKRIGRHFRNLILDHGINEVTRDCFCIKSGRTVGLEIENGDDVGVTVRADGKSINSHSLSPFFLVLSRFSVFVLV